MRRINIAGKHDELRENYTLILRRCTTDPLSRTVLAKSTIRQLSNRVTIVQRSDSCQQTAEVSC